MAKLTLNQILSGFQSNDALNDNFDLIETALENTLSRDGTTPNQMQADLDLNNFNLLNHGNPITISGISWEGAYNAGATYTLGDAVSEGGASYIYINETDSAGNTPPNATYWQVLADAGTLPSQTGNSGKYLTTDGTNASWDEILGANKTYTGDNILSGDNTITATSVTITGGDITGITDLVVADGGTGRSTATAYSILCGGTTATGVHQSVASVGTSGQVLTSNGAGVLPTFQTTGKIAQVVTFETGASSTGTTIINRDNTIPQQSAEGDLFMSLAITPTNVSSTLVIQVIANAANSNPASIMQYALFQDSTEDALAVTDEYLGAANTGGYGIILHKMAAGTTSATTFKIHIGSHTASTTTFNGGSGTQLYNGVSNSSIIITEVLP